MVTVDYTEEEKKVSPIMHCSKEDGTVWRSTECVPGMVDMRETASAAISWTCCEDDESSGTMPASPPFSCTVRL